VSLLFETIAKHYKIGPDRCVYCGIEVEEGISNEADELFKKFSNVRPSCGKDDCTRHTKFLTSNERKKEYLGKRRREIQLGGAQKKKKTNRTPITQQDVETVTLLVQGSWSDTEITDSWIQTMNAWWRKLRGN